MNKKELIEKLQVVAMFGDSICAHSKADDLLIEFINDKDIKEAYENIDRWYA